MKNKSEKAIIFGYTLNVVFNKLTYFFISLFVIYLIKRFIFKSLDIVVPFDNFFWWLIVSVNFIGYFLGRFGMMSRGRLRSIIEFVGWIITIISFIWMWLQFSFGQFLILIPIFIFLTRTLVEGVIEIIYRKLFAEQDREFAKYKGMSAEKVRLDHELDNYESDDPKDIIDSVFGKNRIKNDWPPKHFSERFNNQAKKEEKQLTNFEGLPEEISFDGQNTILFGVKLTKYPIIEEKLLSNPEVSYMKVQEVSEKYHNNNYETAISMIEMDLTPLSEEKREQWWNR